MSCCPESAWSSLGATGYQPEGKIEKVLPNTWISLSIECQRWVTWKFIWLGRGLGPLFGIMTYLGGIPAEPGTDTWIKKFKKKDITWNRGNTIGFFMSIAQGDCWSSGSSGFPSPPPWLVTLLLFLRFFDDKPRTLLKVSRWWPRAYCGRCWRVFKKTEWLVSDWEGLQGKGSLFSSYIWSPLFQIWWTVVIYCLHCRFVEPSFSNRRYLGNISRFFLLPKKTELSQ